MAFNQKPTLTPALTRRQTLALGAAGLLTLAWPGSPLVAAPGGDIVDRYPWMASWVQKDGLKRQWLNDLFLPLKPNSRAKRLMNKQAEAKPYHHYRKLFITSRVIRKARGKHKHHRTLVQKVAKRFDVDGSVVVALWGIESRFGTYMGKHRVLATLFTLATGYPRRAPFFQEELRQYLLLCREEGWDPRKPMGSYAGAMGQVQMIPSTMRRFAVDFDGNGHRDVFNSTQDALASIGHFLQGNGWVNGAPMTLEPQGTVDFAPLITDATVRQHMKPWQQLSSQGVSVAGPYRPQPQEPAALIKLEEADGPRYHVVFNNFRVITEWNRSNRFAMVVHELSRGIRKDA